MPLSGTRVIHRDWSRRHAGPVSTSMNATITFGAPDGDPVPVGDNFEQAWTNVYTGPCGIRARNDSKTGSSAGQTVSGRTYLVQLLFDASGITPGMRGKVLTADNDPDLVGQDLWAIDPQLGSERFTRDVVCSDNQTDVPSA